MLFRSVLAVSILLVLLEKGYAAPVLPTSVEWEHVYRQEPNPAVIVQDMATIWKRDIERQGGHPSLASMSYIAEGERFGTTHRSEERWTTDGNIVRIDYRSGIEVHLPQAPPPPRNKDRTYRIERDGISLTVTPRISEHEKTGGEVKRLSGYDSLTTAGQESQPLRSLLMGVPSATSLLSSPRLQSKCRKPNGEWQLNIEQGEITNPAGKSFVFFYRMRIVLTADGKRISRIERLDKQGDIWQKVVASGNHDIGDGRILPTSIQVILYSEENAARRVLSTEIYRLHRSQIGSKVDLTPLRETLPTESAFITDRRFGDGSESVSYTTSGGLLSENEVQKKWDALQHKKRLAIFWPQFFLTTAIAGTLIGVLCVIRRG